MPKKPTLQSLDKRIDNAFNSITSAHDDLSNWILGLMVTCIILFAFVVFAFIIHTANNHQDGGTFECVEPVPRSIVCEDICTGTQWDTCFIRFNLSFFELDSEINIRQVENYICSDYLFLRKPTAPNCTRYAKYYNANEVEE